ncbi:MAG TPA: DNA-binding response regulator, partial [Clostridiales bacterium]|nr:DNA-binding response regulator [Clostridiales bacterium]
MRRILIVEDEKNIAEIERDYLELDGFEVIIENNGATGLQRALKEEFDLVILDIMLPDMDGFEICRALRKEK